jgi:DNA repair photolyase
MKLENSIYKEHGLKIDKERILTYSQVSCPIECKYCFSDDIEHGQEQGVAYLNEKQLELLRGLPEEVRIIMPGCDTEFFQDRNEALRIIKCLAELHKDIALITKLNLNKQFLEEIKKIEQRLKSSGDVMTLSYSIPCYESSRKWEPKAPSPENRIRSLRDANGLGLNTMVAIRPLLPDVSESELRKIIEETKDHCFGYFSGPLYWKDDRHELVDPKDNSISIEQTKPHWMPEGNIFYKYEKKGQMECLKKLLNEYSKPLFEGSAEGLNKLREKNEKYRT